MATLRDAGRLTGELQELADRLHTEMTDGDGDFGSLTSLADDLAEAADNVAATFTQLDEILSERLLGQVSDETSTSGRRRRTSQARDKMEELSKDELLERARKAGIAGRSGMTKEELKGALRTEESLSKEDLLDRARDADLPGRSDMSKADLQDALRSA